jgi:hypothetical protein
VVYFHAYRSLHEKKMEEMIIFVLAETLNVERLIVVDPFDACNEERGVGGGGAYMRSVFTSCVCVCCVVCVCVCCVLLLCVVCLGATMERVVKEGEVASANIDAHFWKTIPVVQSGRKVIRLIYDQVIGSDNQ